MTGGLWGLATIIGPILLAIVIIWAMRSNRRAKDKNVRRAERGAAELRDEIEEDQNPPH